MSVFIPLLPLLSGLACQRAAPAAPVDAGALRVERKPTPPAAEPPRVPPMGFEADISGVVHDNLHAHKYIVLVSPDPCDPHNLGTTHANAIGHPDPLAKRKTFSVEPFVREGQVLHLCVAAFDASGKRVVGFGAYAKNPITFHKPDDDDEQDIDDVQLTLKPLKPPVPLDVDRY